MNRMANVQGKGEGKKITAGLLNTQNLMAVYWILATQPDLFSKIHPGHVRHIRHK